MSKKQTTLTVGDLFAGVGGFSLGFIRAGFSLSWAVEWDKNCQHVLRKHHPQAKLMGDISAVQPEDLPDVDVIIGGSPCQDLSIAGKRKGLEGERSGLFHEFIRLIRAKRPKWVVWENVSGALSSNGGKDFAAVLSEMADSGYSDISYRVLDARFFGVAQRRRRLFVVASREAVGSAAESRSARVLGLFEPICTQQEGLRRHIEESRKERKAPPPVAKRSSRQADQAVGKKIVEDLLPQEEKEIGQSKIFAEEKESVNHNNSTCQGFRYINNNIGIVESDEIAALRSSMATAGWHEYNHPFVAQAQKEEQATCSNKTPIQLMASFGDKDTVGSLCARDWKGVANQYVREGKCIMQDTSRDALAYDGMNQKLEHDLHHALRTGKDSSDFVIEDSSEHSDSFVMIRRLTPVECCLLMGWPHDWNEFGVDENGKTISISDTQRYKQCGNGVVSNCSQWIAEGIRIIDTKN